MLQIKNGAACDSISLCLLSLGLKSSSFQHERFHLFRIISQPMPGSFPAFLVSLIGWFYILKYGAVFDVV